MKKMKKIECRTQSTEHRYNKKMFFLFFVCVLSSLFLVPSYGAAFAAEEETHAFSWNELTWPIINFTILVAALFYVGHKPIREFFKKRTEMIEKSLKDAEEAKELAKKTLIEVRERLKNTDREIGGIMASAKKAGEKEKDALIANGKRLKDKILEQAKVNIEFELQKAKAAIKSEAAFMALELAGQQIKERVGQKDHENLIHEYIKKFEARN